MITVEFLVACGVHPTQSRTFAPLLETYLTEWGIDTANRVAAFLANAMHESDNFVHLEENLWYTTPAQIRRTFPSRVPDFSTALSLVRNPKALANRVYSKRLGNGDEASGDGFRFRGRGIFMLTGRNNYRNAGAALQLPLEAEPQLVALSPYAVQTAVWFWSVRGCSDYADSEDHRGLAKLINGPAMAGLYRRVSLYNSIRRLIPDAKMPEAVTPPSAELP